MSTAAHEKNFGPSALATPANALTMVRVLGAPALILLIIYQRATWTATVIGLAIALTDGLDGIVARRQGTTTSGAFLDPLADKIVVLGAMFTLVAVAHLPWIPVAIITVREMAIIIYRSAVARQGVSMPARRSAKLKTLVQDLAIGVCLIPPIAHNRPLHSWIIWVAAALTVFSGIQYVIDERRASPARQSEAS